MSKPINFPHLITYGTADEFLGHVSRSVVEYENANFMVTTDNHRIPKDLDVRISRSQRMAKRSPTWKFGTRTRVT